MNKYPLSKKQFLIITDNVIKRIRINSWILYYHQKLILHIIYYKYLFNHMSKTIFYVEFVKPDQSIAKFKFAIDNSKNTIALVKDEIVLKLIAKNQLTNNDDIILKDSKDFELELTDLIDDVIPQQQKNIKVSIKGSQQPNIPVVTNIINNPINTNVSTKITQSPIIIPEYFADKHLVIPSDVHPNQQHKCNQDELQIKFKCPQFQENFNSIYTLVLQKSNTYYQISTLICKKFKLNNQFPGIKAIIYNSQGQPIFWDIDFMGFIQNIDPFETYYVIFNNTTSTFDQPIPVIAQTEEENNLILIKLKQTIGIKVNLEKTTLSDLKVKIYHKLRIHPNNQIIKLGNINLESLDQTLKSLNIVENSQLDIFLKKNHHITSITYSDNFYSFHLKHLYAQSVKSLRVFRSNLFVLSKHLSQKDKIKFLAFVRVYTSNPTLVCSLTTLFNNGVLCQVQKIALQEGFYNLFYRILLNSKDIDPKYNTENVFFATREIFGWILQSVRTLKDSDDYQAREFTLQYKSSCEITQAKIFDPVYIKLDNNAKAISNRITVLEYIKEKKSFQGVATLTQGCIIQDKQLQSIYSIFKQNNSLEDLELTLFIWSPKIDSIDYLQKAIQSLPKPEKIQQYVKSLETLNPKLKIHHPLELKTKVEYIFLLKDKSGDQKIFIGKNKDINNPQTLFDVITGEENSTNFDILGGAAKTQNLEEKINPAELKAIITRQPQQAIVVLLDISGSMGGRFFNEPDLNRMGAVKSFFEAFAYRTMAYNFQHVISLVFFDTRIIVTCDFTQSFQDFNRMVSNAYPQGGTSLYDAIEKGANNLLQLKKKYPNCILRILALTDGQDTGSRCSILKASQLVVNNNIVLDSFVVGSNCQGLKCITFAAGGKCYLTMNIEESLKLFQQETVISYRARKSTQKVSCNNLAALIQQLKTKPFDRPNNVHEFKMPEIQKPALNTTQLMAKINSNSTNFSSGSMKRILKEFNNYQSAPHPFVAIYPCSDMNLWKILLLGPKDTPYEGGLFLLYAKFPNDYPFKPPEVRFITPIYHCNMNAQGRICHSVFDRNYSPAITFKTIIDSVYGLILTPEPEDPLDNVIATFFMSDYPKYVQNAKKATLTNANKPLDEIMEEIFGKITDNNQREIKLEELKEWRRKAESFN